MFRIYGLKCPISGSIRYIGKTKNALKGRLKGHLSDAKSFKYKHHASRWMRTLLRVGLAPEIVLLEESEGDWIEAETRWIAKARELGWPLTNSTAGGDGAPDPTPEVLAQKRRVMRKVWERPEFIERMKEARNDPVFLAEQADRLAGRWKDPKARQKMVASRWDDRARSKQAVAISSPERQAKIAAAMTPLARAKQGAKMKQYWAGLNPEARAAITAKSKANKTPEGKARHSARMKERWARYRAEKAACQSAEASPPREDVK